MACCQKQSTIYIVVTNVLFFACGCILLAFGVLATRLKIPDSILYPVNILKMITILGLILIFTSLIGILGSYYKNRKTLHILYLIFVIITFIYQISVAVIIFDQANHISNWLTDTWNNSSMDYKLYAQRKFHCCGFSHIMDHFIPTDVCIPHRKILTSSVQSCHQLLSQFIQSKLSILYISLFVSLSIEILALTNIITHFCTYSTNNLVNTTDNTYHMKQEYYEKDNEYPSYHNQKIMSTNDTVVRQF